MNFLSSIDFEKEHIMHSKSDNIKFSCYDDANDIVNELFDSLHSRYQMSLETSMRGSDFIFDSVQLLYQRYCKVKFRRGDLYIDSPDWIKKKKATINLKTRGDKCFQNAITVALNYEEIKWNPERVSKIKPFINKSNCKGINYPLEVDDWKTFEKNNLTFALNILYIKEKEMCPAYISKIISNCEKQLILLIPNEEKKDAIILQSKFSALLHGITSKHKVDFYCLKCLHSFRTGSKPW